MSPSNKLWFNAALKPDPHSPGQALDLLAADGFRKPGDTLLDRSAKAVEFSIVTTPGTACTSAC